MKRWKKWTLWILGIFVLINVVILVWNRNIIYLFMTADKIAGEKGVIPEQKSELKLLTKGDSDWVSWRGRDESNQSSAGITTDWSGGLKMLWAADYLCQDDKSSTWSAPVIQGNRLVVMGRDKENDLVFCLDPESGNLLWQGSYKKEASTSWGSGPRATCYIDDDCVYSFGKSGDLVCWKLLDGKKLWHKNVEDEGGQNPRWGHSSSPLVFGSIVIVQGGGTARTIAYDKIKGDVAWKLGSGSAGYAAVTHMELDGKKILLSFHGKGLSGIDPEKGEEIWDVPWKTPNDVNATTPVSSGNAVFISSGYGTGCGLVKIKGNEASLAWKNRVIASHHSDPYIIDGYIYGYSGQSFQNKGVFKCVELETGKEKWSVKKAGWGTCLLADGYLLCMDIKGNLVLVKPDPEKFIKVTEMKKALGNIKGPVWTKPVVANGRLFLRFKQKLVCYRIKEN
ncbi:PQQ-binding-like beta-propeller repeat protein [Planctomycetota bacterium]